MVSTEMINILLERAYRDRTIVLLAEHGLRGVELFCDPSDEKRDGLLYKGIHLNLNCLEVYGTSRDRTRRSHEGRS
jgi:hypothetical protein